MAALAFAIAGLGLAAPAAAVEEAPFTVLSPVDGDVVGGQVKLDILAADWFAPERSSQAVVVVDGNLLGRSAPTIVSVEPAPGSDSDAILRAVTGVSHLSPGEHTLTVVDGNDAHAAPSAPVRVIVDNTAPAVRVQWPQDGSYVSGTVTTQLAFDSVRPIQSVEYDDSYGWVRGTAVEAPFSLTVDTTKIPNGEQDIRAVARDTGLLVSQPAVTHVIVHNPQDTGALCAGVPASSFSDVERTSVHAPNIDCAVDLGLARGRTDTTFEPSGDVTRGQMATFVARLLDGFGALPPAEPGQDEFADDNGSTHEENINRLAQAGIAGGTGNGRFSPEARVSRAQMAAFLARSVEYAIDEELPIPARYFADYAPYDASTYNVDKVAELGVAMGSGATRLFQPTQNVSRAQMTSFLVRTVAALIDPTQ